MFVIGLTGGIGTGKSQVAMVLGDLGADVIEADRLGHEVYRPQTDGWREVVETFGPEVLTPDGEVDRGKLGAAVFGDAEALGRLNAITHPRIRRMIQERIGRLGEMGREVVVVEAALLLEAGWRPLVDEVWVTVAAGQRVVRRLRDRNDLSEKAVLERVRAQMPQDERARAADVIIENDGSLEDLRGQVEALWGARVLRRKRSRDRDDDTQKDAIP
jgi:dephospho-CoA kinase